MDKGRAADPAGLSLRARLTMMPGPRREFHARLVTSRSVGRAVVLTIGSHSIGLSWPDAAPGEAIEILMDGAFVENHPSVMAPPTEIPFAAIERWGPNSPPNVRWRVRPADEPDAPTARILAIVTRDLDYRFLFPDEGTALDADAAVTEAMRAAGYELTEH